MHQSVPDDELFDDALDQLLHDDDGNVIGTRPAVVDNGLISAPADGLVHVLEILSPAEIAAILANRVVIEQAKGMLMTIYGIDADRAFELLKWRSQEANVKLRSLAQQLVEEFPTLSTEERLPTRAGYDEVLLTVHQRLPAEPT